MRDSNQDRWLLLCLNGSVEGGADGARGDGLLRGSHNTRRTHPYLIGVVIGIAPHRERDHDCSTRMAAERHLPDMRGRVPDLFARGVGARTEIF